MEKRRRKLLIILMDNKKNNLSRFRKKNDHRWTKKKHPFFLYTSKNRKQRQSYKVEYYAYVSPVDGLTSIPKYKITVYSKKTVTEMTRGNKTFVS